MSSSSTEAGVTVIVCTKDRARFLGDCLRSIADDVGPADELVVVEDGNSDARQTLDTLSCRWRHVRADGTPKTAKLNRALALAEHDVVLVTDDDCRVGSGWSGGLRAAFDDPDVAIAFGPVTGLPRLDGDQPTVHVAGRAPQEPWHFSHGASMGLRRSSAVEVGGFDEGLGTGSRTRAGEEPDLILRLERSGGNCVLAATPVVSHLAWRDDRERRRSIMGYERGSGAWLGRAVRREPLRVAGFLVRWVLHRAGVGAKPVHPVGQLLGRRLIYQVQIWDQHGPLLGLRSTLAFGYGFALGISRGERRWL